MSNFPAIKYFLGLLLATCLMACNNEDSQVIKLTRGLDVSAGGAECYIITTPSATYYLDTIGGGLSSMVDKDGIDWLGFNNKEGSAHKGEYRGFPNAIHKQDGSYFHAMNAKTDSSSATIEMISDTLIQVNCRSKNKKWQGRYDFFIDHCEFTMTKISPGYKYWVQYEGVPGGEMDSTDFWFASSDSKKHLITEPFLDDLANPEWMAFGDQNLSRTLYILHHQDDKHPDNYVSRPDMTVLGFGRQNKDKYLDTEQTFSIGFVESKAYQSIEKAIRKILK